MHLYINKYWLFPILPTSPYFNMKLFAKKIFFSIWSDDPTKQGMTFSKSIIKSRFTCHVSMFEAGIPLSTAFPQNYFFKLPGNITELIFNVKVSKYMLLFRNQLLHDINMYWIYLKALKHIIKKLTSFSKYNFSIIESL